MAAKSENVMCIPRMCAGHGFYLAHENRRFGHVAIFAFHRRTRAASFFFRSPLVFFHVPDRNCNELRSEFTQRFVKNSFGCLQLAIAHSQDTMHQHDKHEYDIHFIRITRRATLLNTDFIFLVVVVALLMEIRSQFGTTSAAHSLWHRSSFGEPTS